MIKEIILGFIFITMAIFIVVQMFKLFGGWAIGVLILMAFVFVIFFVRRQEGGVEER